MSGDGARPDPDTDAVAHTDADTDGHTDADADAVAHTDTDADTVADADAHPVAGVAASVGASGGRRRVRSEGPRRVRSGLRLRARGGVPTSPLADVVVRRLEEIVAPPDLEEGLRYARIGQVVALDWTPGELRGTVQGSRAQPYDTRLRVGAFADEDWERIIGAMASEAVYVVKLMADELPDGIDELLGAMGLELLPTRAGHLTTACTCRAGGACRHVAAVGYLLAEQLAARPLAAFTLRGMPPDRLLERLRQARTIKTRGEASAHADPMIPESKQEPAALELCVDEFWRPGPGFRDLALARPARHLSHALLRRLGPSPLNGRFPLSGLLASIYDTVAVHAERLRETGAGEA